LVAYLCLSHPTITYTTIKTIDLSIMNFNNLG
jgi:hypothetical protein